MKNLKLNFTFFSLLAVLTISVLMTSCGKENIAPEDNIEAAADAETDILLAKELIEQGEEAVESYLQSLTSAEIAVHVNDYTIMRYLETKGKLKGVDQNYRDTGNFSDLDLTKLLSAEEQTELVSQLAPVSEDVAHNRGCTCYHYYYACGSAVGGGTIYCYSHTICICN